MQDHCLCQVRIMPDRDGQSQMDLMCNHVIMLSVFCCVTLQKVVCVLKKVVFTRMGHLH